MPESPTTPADAARAAHLMTIWRGLFGTHGIGDALSVHIDERVTLGVVAAGLGIVFLAPNSAELLRRYRPLVVIGFAALFVIAVAHTLTVSNIPFLHFQF